MASWVRKNSSFKNILSLGTWNNLFYILLYNPRLSTYSTIILCSSLLEYYSPCVWVYSSRNLPTCGSTRSHMIKSVVYLLYVQLWCKFGEIHTMEIYIFLQSATMTFKLGQGYIWPNFAKMINLLKYIPFVYNISFRFALSLWIFRFPRCMQWKYTFFCNLQLWTWN